jgi:hypothetical protein
MFMELQHHHVQLQQKHGLELMETKDLFQYQHLLYDVQTQKYTYCMYGSMYTYIHR